MFRCPWPASALLVLVALASQGGCYAARPRTALPVGETLAPEERIGVDDTFEVRVYGESELTGLYRVTTDGSIDFPLAGRLHVAGLRPGEVQELLVKKLKEGYLTEPQVTVT